MAEISSCELKQSKDMAIFCFRNNATFLNIQNSIYMGFYLIENEVKCKKQKGLNIMLKKMMYGSALSVLLSAGSTIAIADTAAPAAAPSPAAAPAPAAVPTDEERKKAGEYLECLGSKTGITDAPGGKTAALKLVDITQMPEVKGANPNDDGPFLKAMNEQRKKDGATGPDITEADLQKADAACTK